jgi:hypothetical protein
LIGVNPRLNFLVVLDQISLELEWCLLLFISIFKNAFCMDSLIKSLLPPKGDAWSGKCTMNLPKLTGTARIRPAIVAEGFQTPLPI